MLFTYLTFQSCKRGTTEKRAAKLLHERYSGQQMLENISNPSSPSTSRRLYTDFILTLNASFPDYDYSHMSPQSFELMPSTDMVIADINDHIGELCTIRGANWLSGLWNAVNEVINLKECEVYKFKGSIDDDFSSADETTALLWEFHFFFYNKIFKRIVFFSVSQEHLNLCQDEDMDDGFDMFE